ncbi:MAG: hypothetical protein AB1Z66_00580 [Candidatus Limnocylindrales bacterium]
MYPSRTVRFVVAAVTLALATSAVAVSAYPGEEAPPVHGVVGAVELDAPASLGSFTVVEGTHQYRDIPVTGQDIFADDARLLGRLDATLNYDIHRSGQEPVPAWGALSIDDGSWTGTFTGIRRHDFEPFEMSAFLVGTGEYDGLCAVLDITAGPESWAIDGVIHPLPMGA